MVRLVRHPNSIHYGDPRLFQVTLQSANEAEEVLLSATRLRTTSCTVRIFPDVPWSERQKRKQNPDDFRKRQDAKSVLVHGVPELKISSDLEAKAHDWDEWRFIRELLSLENVIATSTSRLPLSPNYKGCGLRVMKIPLHSEMMVEYVINTWRKMRQMLPSEIRIKTMGTEPPTGHVTLSKQRTNTILPPCSSDQRQCQNTLPAEGGQVGHPPVGAESSIQRPELAVGSAASVLQKYYRQPTPQGSA
ncbi:unnamed protein product [Dicrocoelium dendriticum]|nr:unnamed protein product [Dicrocoelium dendriticum]